MSMVMQSLLNMSILPVFIVLPGECYIARTGSRTCNIMNLIHPSLCHVMQDNSSESLWATKLKYFGVDIVMQWVKCLLRHPNPISECGLEL